MADREHPKKHSDKGSRKQPLSPQHEGIDPLTEGDKLYPAYDTKAEAEKLRKKETKSTAQNDKSADEVEQDVADQKAVEKSEENAAEETADSKKSDSSKGKTSGSTTSSR